VSYRLYWAPNTGAFVVQAMLEWAGAPYELIPLDFRGGAHKQASYLSVNPMGQIPALVLPDGEVMTESAAITLYLGDAFPETGLVPPPGAPGRARLLRWLLFLACNVYDENLRFNAPQRYSADAGCLEAVKASAAERLERHWALLAEALEPGPGLLGERPCAADLYLVMMTDWALPRAGLLERHPALARVFALVREQPAVARIWLDNEMD